MNEQGTKCRPEVQDRRRQRWYSLQDDQLFFSVLSLACDEVSGHVVDKTRDARDDTGR